MAYSGSYKMDQKNIINNAVKRHRIKENSSTFSGFQVDDMLFVVIFSNVICSVHRIFLTFDICEYVNIQKIRK